MLLMNPNDIDESVRQAADRWWVRQDSGDLSEHERAAFESWLNESEAHRKAFARLTTLWSEFDALRPRYADSRNPVSGAAPRRSRPRAWALAASTVIAAAGLSLALSRSDYSAPIGEIRTVNLADGSRVTLASGSRLNIDYTTQQRRLELLDGEAWFEVAHDPARPFSVQAGRGTATALGTVYDVRKQGDRVRVTVSESRVAISHAGAPPSARVIVGAGQQSAYSDTAGPSLPVSIDLDAASAWRRGRLVFENRPLGEVVEELNRYHPGLIAITDDTVRNRAVSGVFRIDHPGDIVATLEQSLGIKSTRITDYLTLLHR